MALQVWLPLSGNTDNIGLDNTESSTIGEILYASGIFGGRCFYAGKGAVVANLDSVPANFTVSLWFKGLVVSSNATLIAFGETGDRIELDTNEVAYIWRNSGTGMLPDGTKLFNTFFDNTWNHLAVSADGTTVKVYLNGNNIFTGDQSDAVETAFGNLYAVYFGSKIDGTGKWNGYIQDIKIFDHVLSTKEILEISDGLVLEYTFNHNGFGNENLLNGSDGKFELQSKNDAYWLHNDLMYAVLQPGTYTLSATTDGKWTNVQQGVAGADNEDRDTVLTALEVYTKNGDNIVTRTFCDMTVNNSCLVTISLAGTYYIGAALFSNGITTLYATIDNVKLEEGTKATPWIPPKSSQMYIDMEIGTIEQDTSGNELDAEISVPAPDWSNDTRIFSGSYDFANGAYIKSPVLDVTQLTSFTVSIWAKGQNLRNKILFGFDSGRRFNFSTVNGIFGIYDVENQRQLAFGDGISVDNYVSMWHWYTITGDGVTEKLYIDGEFVGNLTGGYVPFGMSRFYVNGWDETGLNNFNGLLSDMRIYCTTFTAAKIAAKYHQKAIIDNTGKIYAAEFVTGEEATNFRKTGVVGSPNLTTFNTPIDEHSTTTDDADKFKIAPTQVIAVNVIES